MVRRLSVLFLVAVLSACQTTNDFMAGFSTGPYPNNIGGEKLASPSIVNFRGLPVVQVSFLVNADATAESAFFTDYNQVPAVVSYSEDEPESDTLSDPATASTNLQGMFAKSAFYAIHLAKFLKIKSDGEFIVILNPMTLRYDTTRGYSYEPFEKNMPGADVEIFFGAYVHPNTKPSTKGNLTTTYGESLAPIVSIRTDPAFNPGAAGAIALKNAFQQYAVNADGKGARAQFIDLLNAKRYNAKTLNIAGNGKSTGVFELGSYYSLDFDSEDLEQTPIPETIIPAVQLSGHDYNPGTYFAYRFYEPYYRAIVAALNLVDNRRVITSAQKAYLSYYDPNGTVDFESVLLGQSDRRMKRFLSRARQIELQYLEDRDNRWMDLVLSSNDFRDNFAGLRDAEQNARDEYINTQVQAGIGLLLAVAGAAAAAHSNNNNNNFGTAGGAALAGVGIAMVASAMAEIGEIDVAFGTAFETAYNSQKDYVFEIAEGEKINVRAKDYAGFKAQLRKRFDQRFQPTS